MSRFYFKNLNTGEGHYSDELGIYVRKMPDIPVTKKVIDSYPVAGRDGTLTIDRGYYSDITFPLELIIVKQQGEDLYRQLDQIYNWLTGRGELNFGSYLDDKHLITKIIEIGDLFHVMQAGGLHTINLLCEPFKYSPLQTVDFIGETHFYNPSPIESKPLITVYGTGNIDLTVNGAITQLKNVSEYVVLDSEAMTIFKDITNKSMDKIGPYPVLKPGLNTISAAGTGTTDSIKIETKWRWK